MDKEAVIRILTAMFIVSLDQGKAHQDNKHLKDLSWEHLNPQVPVAIIQRARGERDAGLNNPNDCYPDEYWSNYYRSCKTCTRCSPGTQHDPPQPCGNGQGQEAHCIPCEDGLYQSQEGIAVLSCQPCLVCDPQAVVKRVCTQRRNTKCGRCQKGWYYGETNVCVECTEADTMDSNNEDCYNEPDPIPELEPSHDPVLDLQPAQGSSSSPPEDGSTPGTPLKKSPAPVANPQPPNQLSRYEVTLAVIGSIVAVMSLAVAGLICILKRRKPKKKNGIPPPHEEQEMKQQAQLLVQPDSTAHTESRSEENSFNSSTSEGCPSAKSELKDECSKPSPRTITHQDPDPPHLGLLSHPKSLKSHVTMTSDSAADDRLPDMAADRKEDHVGYDISPNSKNEKASGFSNNDDTEPMSGYGELTSNDRPPSPLGQILMSP